MSMEEALIQERKKKTEDLRAQGVNPFANDFRPTHSTGNIQDDHGTRTAEELCATYGYRPIQTPVFEDTKLFQRTSGQGSDVVQKEMYSFADRSGRSLTLRPEATAPSSDTGA